jgi:hypothetical protein
MAEDFSADELGFGSEEYEALMRSLGEENGSLPSEAKGREYDENIAEDVAYLECPSCHHRWPK